MFEYGNELAKVREVKKLSQREIADALGITLRSYQRYEAGDREPTISLLVALSRFYRVSLDTLFGLERDDSKTKIDKSIFNTSFVEKLLKIHDLDLNSLVKTDHGFGLGRLSAENRKRELQKIVSRIGPKLKKLRTKREFSVEDVAIITSISSSDLQKYEEGIIPTRSHTETLAGFFGISIDELFGMGGTNAVPLWRFVHESSRVEGMTLSDEELALLIEMKYIDFAELKAKKLPITNALLLFKFAEALNRSVYDVFDYAQYSYFDFDQFDPSTGERIVVSSDNEVPHA
jgi:transcriptional regulator with XRE-family HTH domain